MNLRREKGAIAIFVLVALLFMTSFLMVLYASNVSKSKVVKEQFNIITDIYSHSGGDIEAYDKAYANLRKKNKQTMIVSVEDRSTIELTKTFDEPMSNYKIYGKGTKATEIKYIDQFKVTPTNSGFIPMNEGKEYPEANSTYPNATYTVIDIKAGQTLNFKFSATETEGNYGLRVRCIDAETNNVVNDLVNDTSEKFENLKEYCDTTIYYSFTRKENGYIKAKKDFKIGIMYIVNKPEDFNLEITRELGGLPLEYQLIEYIESTGKQYIDTQIKPTNLTSIEVEIQDFDTSTSYPNVFGAIGGGYYDLNRVYLNYANKTNQSVLITNTTKYIKLEKGGILTIDSSTGVVDLKDTTIFSITNDLYLFARNRGNEPSDVFRPGKFKLKQCKIWEDTILVRYMLPCFRISDSKVGLYDMINNVFYQNGATEEDFKKGPNVNLCKETVGDIITDTNDENNGKYKIPIKLTNEKGESITKDIILNEPLYDGDYIDFKTKKVVRSNGTEESIDLPEILTFEDYTKIEVLTATAPSKIEVEYLGYTISDNDSNIIPGFTKLEYIESTGTQWIDTGMQSINAKIEITFKFNEIKPTSQVLVNCYKTTGGWFGQSSGGKITLNRTRF